MSGAIHPLPNTPSWRGAYLKHRDNFTFYLYSVEEDRKIIMNYEYVRIWKKELVSVSRYIFVFG
jgi:hypothetical protein